MNYLLSLALTFFSTVVFAQEDVIDIPCNSMQIPFEIKTWDGAGNGERNCPIDDEYPNKGTGSISLNGIEVPMFSTGKTREACKKDKEFPVPAVFKGCASKGLINKSGANRVSIGFRNQFDDTYVNSTQRAFANTSLFLMEWARQGAGEAQVFSGQREILLSAFVLSADSASASKVLTIGQVLDRLARLLALNDNDLSAWKSTLADLLNQDAMTIDVNSLGPNIPQWFKDLITNIQNGVTETTAENNKIATEVNNEKTTNQRKISDSIASMGESLSESEVDEELELDQDKLDDEQIKDREHKYLTTLQAKLGNSDRAGFLQTCYDWEGESKQSTNVAIEINSTKPGYYSAFLASQERILAFIRTNVDENYFFLDVPVSQSLKMLIDGSLKAKNPELAKRIKEQLNVRYKDGKANNDAVKHLEMATENYVQSSDNDSIRVNSLLIDDILKFLDATKDFVECEIKTSVAGIYAKFYEVIEGRSFCDDTPLDDLDRTLSFVDFGATASSKLGFSLGTGVSIALTVKKMVSVVAPVFKRLGSDKISKMVKTFIDVGSAVKFGSFSEFVESFKSIFKIAKSKFGSADELGNFMDIVNVDPKSAGERLSETLKGMKYPKLWTDKKKLTSVQNAYGHFKKHGHEFPEINNAIEYVEHAHSFMINPPTGTLKKVRTNGDELFYHSESNTFAIRNMDGAPRTVFKPDPAKHGFATNIDYFNAQ